MTAASALCLALLPAQAGAQTFEQATTEPALQPPPANSVDPNSLEFPAGTPPYFKSALHSYLRAPLPAKIFKQGGIPKVLPGLEIDKAPGGEVATFRLGNAPTITKGNAFFDAFPGSNGRACVTCHQPPSGWSISLRNIKARFRNTKGKDPLFQPVDGANCPSAVPMADTSGSLIGGYKGRGKKALKEAHSLLLNKGLIRIPLPLPPNAEFSIEITAADDRPGCNLDPEHGFAATGNYSFYRRPLITTNLNFKTAPDDQASPPDRTPPTSIMWDGREPDLLSQARDATRGHAQVADTLTDPSEVALLEQIVTFERELFSAQWSDKKAKRLDDGGATGGPVNLSNRTPIGVFTPGVEVFDEFDSWANLTGGKKEEMRASIERGQKLFNANGFSFPGGPPLERGAFIIAGVGGFNDLFGGGPATASCSVCHSVPHAGNDPVAPVQRDIGTGGHAQEFGGPAPSPDLPIFKVTCNVGNFPFRTTNVLRTNDLGSAMITGQCEDIGKKTVPQLRALASHEPFFSDGSAKTIGDVVSFYQQRFTFIDPVTQQPQPLTRQERQDLINFLSVL